MILDEFVEIMLLEQYTAESFISKLQNKNLFSMLQKDFVAGVPVDYGSIVVKTFMNPVTEESVQAFIKLLQYIKAKNLRYADLNALATGIKAIVDAGEAGTGTALSSKMLSFA